jgi:predicted metalloprotease with PDZ domain
MRALWQRFGKPASPLPGLVARPYSLSDLRDVLADVSGNRAFADEFFDKYVEGRDVVDYTRLLDRAGFSLRRTSLNAAWVGVSMQQTAEGLTVGGRIGGLVPFGTPAYEAGLEQGDLIRTIDGRPATLDAWDALRRRKPGERVSLGVVHRGGVAHTATVVLGADPSLEIRDLGQAMTEQQRSFRAGWLGPRTR